MRRLCLIQIAQVASLWLVAWFFLFEHPLPGVEGVIVKGVVGPFTSELACQAEREELAGFPFPGLKVSKCVDRKEA